MFAAVVGAALAPEVLTALVAGISAYGLGSVLARAPVSERMRAAIMARGEEIALQQLRGSSRGGGDSSGGRDSGGCDDDDGASSRATRNGAQSGFARLETPVTAPQGFVPNAMPIAVGSAYDAERQRAPPTPGGQRRRPRMARLRVGGADMRAPAAVAARTALEAAPGSCDGGGGGGGGDDDEEDAADDDNTENDASTSETYTVRVVRGARYGHQYRCVFDRSIWIESGDNDDEFVVFVDANAAAHDRPLCAVLWDGRVRMLDDTGK